MAEFQEQRDDAGQGCIDHAVLIAGAVRPERRRGLKLARASQTQKPFGQRRYLVDINTALVMYLHNLRDPVENMGQPAALPFKSNLAIRAVDSFAKFIRPPPLITLRVSRELASRPSGVARRQWTQLRRSSIARHSRKVLRLLQQTKSLHGSTTRACRRPESRKPQLRLRQRAPESRRHYSPRSWLLIR